MTTVKLAILVVAMFSTPLITGCTQSTASLTTGMKMQDAVSEMEKRGIPPQQMAYAATHNAFDLTDGRTVVLIGDKTVDDIQVIENPDEPKSKRKTGSVDTFEL